MELTVKSNNGIFRENCPVCDTLHKDAQIPQWIFPVESGHGACRQCAQKHAPELLADVDHCNELFWNQELQNTTHGSVSE